jgi:DNA-binding GntR family transcriptional regulator
VLNDMDSSAARVRDSSMALHAYAAIKKRILDFRYVPGERLSEAQLAKELGLGRSPIRTALARLKSDGWIAVSPQSGTYVRSLTDREISKEELRKLRRAFAAFCPEGVQDLTERAFDNFNEFDSLFHVTLYRAAGNALIAEILANLLDKVQWLKTSTAPSAARIRSGYIELRRILDSLDARDPKAAAARMRDHISNAATFSAEARARWRGDSASADPESPAQLRRPRGRRAA